MKCHLFADKACCGVHLRSACIAIGILFLVLTGLGFIFPLPYTHWPSLVAFLVNVVGGVCLLVGALKNKRWLVFVWLMNGLLILVFRLFLIGVIIYSLYYPEFGPPLNESVYLVFLEQFVVLVVLLVPICLVVSFFRQLGHSQAPRPEPVISRI